MNVRVRQLIIVTGLFVCGCSLSDETIVQKAKKYHAQSEISVIIDAFVSANHRMPENKAQVIEFLSSWVQECPEDFQDGRGAWLCEYFNSKRTRMVCYGDSCFFFSPIIMKNGYSLYGLPKEWLQLWLMHGRITDFFPRYSDVFYRNNNTPILSMLHWAENSPFLNLRELYDQYPHRVYVQGLDGCFRPCGMLMQYNNRDGLSLYSNAPDTVYCLAGHNEYHAVNHDLTSMCGDFFLDLEKHISEIIRASQQIESVIFYCVPSY